MANSGVKVEVKGVKELQRELKRIDADLPREMKNGFLNVANRVVAKVTPKVPHKSGTAAGSLAGRATQRGAAIVAGGRKAPYYPWLDFGGSVGRGHVGPWSGAIKRLAPKGGNYIYPTVAENREIIADEVDDFMRKLAIRGAFETKGHA